MRVAIYSRAIDQDYHTEIHSLISALAENKIEPVIYQPFFEQLHESVRNQLNGTSTFRTSDDLDESVEFIISLGGDGTLLDTVTLVRDKKIAILGINFGRLGFLASIGKEEMKTAVASLKGRNFVVDSRSLIHLDADRALFETPYALNEFAIHKTDTSPMIKIHTYLNGEFLNTYWADGLIVSTPTGSTGYSLSCGGPIVFPESGSFVITPVAPHNLNVRPIVVPDDNIISFEVEGRADHFICSLDSRRELVPRNIQLAVRRETFDVNILRLNENNFLTTLRKKLSWGLDTRN